ncbi:MAG: hypothetical protein JO347_00945, partial [Candidatus Eremiobacteraeota bacterium]|nr:hypothetical protein [Candidatus Eremiobacteraeota bacterium]
TGACPAAIRFAGTIAGTQNQAVTYYFTRTIKGVATSLAPVSASLDATGTLHVADAISIDSAHAGPGSDTITLLPSNIKTTATFTVACTMAGNGTSMSVLMTKPHTYVPESTGAYTYPYTPDLSRCATHPAGDWTWQVAMVADLRAGYTAEKGYLQEKDAYSASATTIGFAPEVPGSFCITWTFYVGHFSDEQTPADSFVITARHIGGGPMLCITDRTGSGHPPGEVGISSSGGPIQTPPACGSLPSAHPTNPYNNSVQPNQVQPH